MRPFDRRDFLKASASAAGLLSFAALDNTLSGDETKKAEVARPGDKNSQLRVAVVGVRSRGMSHVGAFAGSTKLNTIITTVCDCDSGVIGNAMTRIEEKQKKAPKFEQDFRKVIEDPNIDIISIATPNHWHALMAIWAMEHGKHVYVEKPVSHNVREGRMMVAAARKYGRICQTGTQSRSTKGMRESIAFVHSGKIGKVSLARGLCYKGRPSIGKVTGDQKPPATMDYDLWCGPAPMKMPHRNTKNGTVHYDWHWIWDYGNGDLGNQGIHEMDKARWGLGKMTMPKSVVSLGGRLGYVDDGETANTQLCIFDYGDAELIFEVRGLPTKPYKGAGVGNIFYGTDGYVVCPNYSSGTAYDKEGNVLAKFSGGGDGEHFENFVKAVRAGKREILNADIEDGHLSSALCHLGNISYRLGETVPFSKNPFESGKEAADSFARMCEHLKENKVDLEKNQYRLGRRLQLDTKTETIPGDKEASAMLFREYRKGFQVPEKI